MVGVDVQVVGADAIVAKLQDASMYGPAWKDVFEQVADWVYSKAQKRAPMDTGNLLAGMALQKDARAIPTWAKITNNAVSDKGMRYPFVLEAGRRAPRGLGMAATNRRTALRDVSQYIILHRRGRKSTTRKWLRGSLGGARKQALTLCFAAAMKIEREWSS